MMKRYEVTTTFISGVLEGKTSKETMFSHGAPHTEGEVIEFSSTGAYRVEKVVEVIEG